MSCEVTVRRFTMSAGAILTAGSIPSSPAGRRALSQSMRSSCLAPDRDRRSIGGSLAVGSGRGTFRSEGADDAPFVGSGLIDMALTSGVRVLHPRRNIALADWRVIGDGLKHSEII